MLFLCFFLVSCNADSKLDCKENWGLCAINKNNYKENIGEEPIKIAIIDSGIDDQKANVNVVERFNGSFKDSNGHGTAIASIIGSKKKFFGNFEGVIQNAEIYDVNVLDKNGKANIEDIVEGIEWSIKNKVDIINMSFGIEKDDSDLHEAIRLALENNVVIIAAAGNKMGLNADYPAKYEGVISISSVNKELEFDPYAAKGKIDYVAPGVEVQAVKIMEMNTQKKLSGTSFATAYATGIIATLLDGGKVNKYSIKDDLVDYTTNLGDSKYYGNGLLHLNNN